MSKIEKSDIMNNDIFRKRPILGNRILTPIRDEPKRFERVMSMWEAEERCQYYKENKSSFLEPPTGCMNIEMSPNGITKYWMWGCNCDVMCNSPNRLIAKMKKLAFNWE